MRRLEMRSREMCACLVDFKDRKITAGYEIRHYCLMVQFTFSEAFN